MDQGAAHGGENGEAGQSTEDLRRERDALAARVAALESRRGGRRRVRRAAVVVLVVLGVASFTSSAVGWWARRNLADTSVWIDRVGTLPEEPAFRAALGTWLSDEIVELVDPSSLFAEVLPERGRLLAVPLGGAVEDFIRERVDGFLASDRFQELWVAANERAHAAVIRVLRGESDVLETERDRVVINLVPAIDAALADIGSASPDLLGRQVNLPDLTVDDLPDAAVTRLEDALGIPLDDDFGQIVVYDHGRLRALQDGLERARRWLIALSVLTVVSFGAALWASDRRRRTLLQILGGLALGISLIRRLGLRGQRELLASIPEERNRDAAETVSDRFVEPLLAVTQTILVVLALLAVVVVLSGPYPWVVRLRRHAIGLVRSLREGTGQAGSGLRGGSWVDWAREHAGLLRTGGVVLVVVLLLVVDLSFPALFVLAVLVGLGALALRAQPVASHAALDDAGRPR